MTNTLRCVQVTCCPPPVLLQPEETDCSVRLQVLKTDQYDTVRVKVEYQTTSADWLAVSTYQKNITVVICSQNGFHLPPIFGMKTIFTTPAEI